MTQKSTKKFAVKFKEGDLIRRVNIANTSAMPVGSEWRVVRQDDAEWVTVEGFPHQCMVEAFERVQVLPPETSGPAAPVADAPATPVTITLTIPTGMKLGSVTFVPA